MADTETITIAVGDHVRLKNRDVNAHASYVIVDPHVAYTREPADGLVLSIRDIRTGQLMTTMTTNVDELDQFVIEMLYDNTFNPRYASSRNASKTADRPSSTPAWKRMRAMLRDLAQKGELLSTNAPNFLTESPMAKYLDGWKILKVRSHEISTLEKPAPAQAAPSA